MSWKTFLQYLLTAAVSGAATAVATNLAGGNTKAIGSAAGLGAIIGVANQLRIPPSVPVNASESNQPKP